MPTSYGLETGHEQSLWLPSQIQVLEWVRNIRLRFSGINDESGPNLDVVDQSITG